MMETNSRVADTINERLVMDLATQILSAMIVAQKTTGPSLSMISAAIATAKQVIIMSKHESGFRTKEAT